MSKERMLENIANAQAAVDQEKEKIRNGKMRQHYHFMSQTGWINDPNGLIYYQGKYHFFFQNNPYYGFWDYIHWGHAVSEDLVHWEYLPFALAPSESYDDHMRGGCFSGSAIEHDGKLFLIYTGCANHGDGYVQTQCIAWSEDGIHFEKYEGNPVLLPPEGIAPDQFRDPKIWRHEGSFYMVCGASREGKGQALLYRSEDIFHWEFVSVLAESRGEWGYMWECPDFYPLGDKYILTVSPMGAGEHTSVYFVGDFDYETGRFFPQVVNEMDWGMDYYAPQSLLAPDGRRIIVSWANEWEWMPFWKDWGPTYQEGWCGFYNIPREVRLMPDGTLQFVPVRELEKLRRDGIQEECMVIENEERPMCAGDGISFEMKMEIDLTESDAKSLELDLRCGEGKKTVCIFDFEKAQLTVDRNQSDGWSKDISRSLLFLKGKKSLDIHIFSDQSSLEIFSDQYQNNHSNNIYASDAQNQIRVKAYGGKAVIRNYESYRMEDCF